MRGRAGIRWLSVLLLAFAVLAEGGAARAEPRIALVIGNSNYGGEIGNLANPANDAKLIAKTLRGIGFDVLEVEDADQNAMKRAIVDFGNKLSDAGSEATGLFYYAGHGVQVEGENFLVPVKAKIQRESDVDVEAVSADLVLRQMDFAGSAVNIIILDACRNNPLTRGFRSEVSGLAEITRKPRGSFIAYSTAPGEVAADGSGANSPYAQALAQTIVEPGQGIEEVFREVRAKVLAVTDNKQTTWDSSSLTAPFDFVAPTMVAAAVAPPPAPATTAPSPEAVAVDPTQFELAFWSAVKDTPSIAGYQAYLKKYPNGEFAPLAEIGIANLKAASVTSQTRAVTPPPSPPPVQQPVSKSGPASPAPKADQPDAAQASVQPPAAEDGGASTAPTPTRSADFNTCKFNSGSAPTVREAACRNALKSDKLEPDAQGNVLNWLGLALFDEHRLDEALATYRSGLEIKPSFAALYYNIGIAYRDKFDFTEARAAFDKAASLNPQGPAPILERGLATAFLGDAAAGVADMQKAIALKSDDYHYFTKLMRGELVNGDLPAATAAIDRAIAVEPRLWDGAGVLVYYLGNSRDKLDPLLARAMDHAPDFPYWYLWKGLLLKKAGDEAGANAAIENGRQRIRNIPWEAALFDYAAGDITLGELRARVRSNNPRAQSEHTCSINFFVGELAMIAGDRDGARTAWQRAVDSQVYYFGEYGAAKIRLAQLGAQ
jgi:carboxyl-terminal processing protease